MNKKVWMFLIIILVVIISFIVYSNKTETISTEFTIPLIPFNVTGGPDRVPMAPGSICSIEAEITNIEKKNTSFGEFALSNGRENFEYYLIKLKISNIKEISSNDVNSCNNFYLKDVEDKGITFLLSDFESHPISIGQQIKANIESSGDEYFSGYFFKELTTAK